MRMAKTTARRRMKLEFVRNKEPSMHHIMDMVTNQNNFSFSHCSLSLSCVRSLLYLLLSQPPAGLLLPSKLAPSRRCSPPPSHPAIDHILDFSFLHLTTFLITP